MSTVTHPTRSTRNLAPARPTLANFWHPIATAGEVTDQPKQFKLLGEELVVFRDAEGVVAMKDLCIHRGTALSLGWISEGRLTCGYHGWQYDRSGACVRIPSLPEGASIPRKARAIVHRAAEAYGLVWVALSDPVQPIPPWPDNAYDGPGFHTFLLHHKVWRSSAGRACENALDFSHFNFAHRGYLELADPVIKPHSIQIGDFSLKYTYIDASAGRDYFLYAPFTMFIKKYLVDSHEHSLAWDARSTPRDGLTIVSQFHTPLDETSCIAYVHISRNHSLDMDDHEFAGELAEVVLDQDRMIVESQKPEQIPLDLREELHLKVPDATGIAYRRILGQIDAIAPFMP